MEETTGKRNWLWRILDFINPLRDPSLIVAAVLTFIQEAGQNDPWYIILLIALINWLAVRGIVWLAVNFTFAVTFLARRFWWAIRHPRLAWRILDAIGHEEIVIGGLPTLGEGMYLQDGSAAIMSPVLGASGIHVIGELPAGTEVPMLSMPNGQMSPDFAALANTGFFPGMSGINTINATPGTFGNQSGTGYSGNVSHQSTDELPRAFPQRPSEEEERLRQQLAAIERLMDDWIQYTEEKWRTVSDSQLGWKPLRGRWASWDDIFQDVYAAKTSDPMAEAAQAAGDSTARRYENSKEKGSAASAVACFMRDMMTLRRGIDILQQPASRSANMESTMKASTPKQRFPSPGTSLLGNSGITPRNSLIRRPAPMFVDADTDK